MARDLPYRARPSLILGAAALLVVTVVCGFVAGVPTDPTVDGHGIAGHVLAVALAAPAASMVVSAVVGMPLASPRAPAPPPSARRLLRNRLVLVLGAAALTALLAARAVLVGGQPLLAVAAGVTAVAATLIAVRIPERTERAPAATAGRRTEPNHPPRGPAAVRRLVVAPALAGAAGLLLGALLVVGGAIGVDGGAGVAGGTLVVAAIVPLIAAERERAALTALSGFARHDLSPLAAAAESGDVRALDADDSARLPRYVAHRTAHLDLTLSAALTGVPGAVLLVVALSSRSGGPVVGFDVAVVTGLVVASVALLLPPALRERRTLRRYRRTDGGVDPD